MRLRALAGSLILVSSVRAVGCDRGKAQGQAEGQAEVVAGRERGEPGEPNDAEASADDGASNEEPSTQADPKVAKRESFSARREELRKRHSENPEQGRARGESLRASVNAGRKLVKEGKLDEGIAKYREALTIDPNFRPAMGELGWAEFNAGQYQNAHAHSLRALDLAETDKQRGMYLYNLGRIAEATGDVDDAIARYQVSLARRPNKVVRKRLDTLLADHDGPVVDATTARGLDVLAVAATEEELCGAAVEHGMCGMDDECYFDHRPAHEDGGFGLLFSGDITDGCYHVVAEREGKFHLFETVSLIQYGTDIVQGLESSEAAFETTDQGRYWVLRFKDAAEGHGWNDDVDPDLVFFEAEKVVVCQWTDRGPACTHPIAASYEGESEAHGRQRYNATVTLEGDRVVVDAMTHSVKLSDRSDDVSSDEALFLPVDRYPFHDLARRAL